MITAITPFICIASFLLSNVTGQGTRHLVAGTLDPLVQLIHFVPFSVADILSDKGASANRR